MTTLTEDAQALWRQIQAEQAPDAEPQEITEADRDPLAEEPAIAADAPVSNAPAEVSQAEYIEALLDIAAGLKAENDELRRIAASALEQAREVEQLREMLGGVTEPAPPEEDPSPDLSLEFMAATGAAVEALRNDIETLRSEDTALLGDILALRSELRALAEPSRRRWWRFGR
jgi:hypothetical protein